MRKLVEYRIARAVFCLSVALLGASAQAYKCERSYAMDNVDHWYNWFQSSRDCEKLLKTTYPTPSENVAAALEFLGTVKNVSSTVCKSPLITKAMAQSARINKAAQMVAAMKSQGYHVTDDQLILEVDHAAIEYLRHNAPKLLSGFSGEALYRAEV